MQKINAHPRLIVMVGVPGAGKTTFARKTFPNALRVSLDDLRLMLSGRLFDTNFETAVAVAGDAILEALIAKGTAWRRDVLMDATNVSRSRRARLIRLAHQHGLSPVAVHVTCPIDVAQERNASRPNPVPRHVVASFHRRLEPPTIGEGFAEVIVVDGATGA